MFLQWISLRIFLILPLIFPTFSKFILDPARFTHSRVARQYQETKPTVVHTRPSMKVDSAEGPDLENTDMVSWLRLHSVKAGNSSDLDLKIVLSSVRQMERPEFPKFPKIQVYNYEFGEENVKELLLYTDPDLERQWIVNIEELDMRQNLIVFPLGDLGFGFRKEDTFVVLRKSKSKSDPFHYIHLVYLTSKSKKGKDKEVDLEWDNIKPQDIVPIPISFQEDQDDHASHCKPRKCGLLETIFGTCVVIKLGCSVLHNLPVNGHDKERMDALIREKQPFIYELAKILTINQRYWRNASDEDGLVENADEGHARNRRAFTRHGRRFGKHNHHPRPKPRSMSKPKRSVDETGFNLASDFLKSKEAKVRSASGEPPSSQDSLSSHHEPEEHDKSSKKGERNEEIKDEGRGPQSGENLPSSFDLLTMKNGSSSPFSGTPELENAPPEVQGLPHQNDDSYFAYILEQIRNSPPSKYTVKPLECIACERMGTFLSDYEDSILISFVANNIITDIFRDVESKKNIFSPEGHDLLREDFRVPYVGYGNCDYSKNVLSHPPQSVEVDDMISYYSESLGVNCHTKLGCESQEMKHKMREMLTSRYHLLEVWPDMSIRFNKSSMLPKNLILSTNEFREFMTALIFSAYTEQFRMHATHYQDNRYDNPDLANRHQSHRMKFQTRVILRVIDELIRNYPPHLIKGLRFLLQLLQDKYLSLVGEAIGILELKETHQNKSFYKATNKNDRIQVAALKDFIINGIAPMRRSGAGSSPSFITYFNRNYKRISHLFVDFGIERPHFPDGAQRNVIRSVGNKELEMLFGKLAEGNQEEGEKWRDAE